VLLFLTNIPPSFKCSNPPWQRGHNSSVFCRIPTKLPNSFSSFCNSPNNNIILTEIIILRMFWRVGCCRFPACNILYTCSDASFYLCMTIYKSLSRYSFTCMQINPSYIIAYVYGKKTQRCLQRTGENITLQLSKVFTASNISTQAQPYNKCIAGTW